MASMPLMLVASAWMMLWLCIPIRSYGQSSEALFQHIARGDVEAVQRLLEEGEDPNVVNERGMTPLVEAARGNDLEMVRMLLRKGADPNANTTMWRPVLFAVGQGHLDVLAALLEHGAEPVELGAAVANDQLEALRMLLDAGADPNAEPEHGEWPVIEAVEAANREALSLLLEAGADPNGRKKSGDTALRLAIVQEETDMARMLLEAGANPDGNPSTNRDGLTPLVTAIRAEQIDVVQLLLDHGANANLGYRGHTALDFAIETEHLEIVSILLAGGADPNHLGGLSDTQTPLTRALQKENPELARMLFEAGGDPHIRIDTGQIVQSEDGGPQELMAYKRVEIDRSDNLYPMVLEHRFPVQEDGSAQSHSVSADPTTSEALEDEDVPLLLWWVHRLSTDQVAGIEVDTERVVVPKSMHAWPTDVAQYDILWLREQVGDLPPFDRRVVDIQETEERTIFHTYPAALDHIVRRLGSDL